MNRLMRRATVGLAVLAGVLATGCGGTAGTADRTEAPAASEPPAATTSPTAAPSPVNVDVTMISVPDYLFSPANPSFPSGAEITVVNDSPDPHTFTVEGTDIDVEVPASSPGLPLQMATVALDVPSGTYRLYCRFHVGAGMAMETELTITD